MRRLALIALFGVVACGDPDPLPSTPKPLSLQVDLGWYPGDAGDGLDDPIRLRPDFGLAPDSGTGPDGGSTNGGPDGGVDPDGGTGARDGDDDQDTIRNVHEGLGNVDTDGDGTPDSLDPDSDGDGITDRDEAGDADPITPPEDTDRDGVPDYRDLDSDGDGLGDAFEGNVDTDDDGRLDAHDTDSDQDGLPDRLEGAGDPDGDGVPNFRDLDSDGDGLLDAFEQALDPDQDGVPAFLDLDSDGDGAPDALEGADDPDADGMPSFLDLDSDGDSLPDTLEGEGDPDGDGTPNRLDPDSDGDGIRDVFEGAGDVDGDGLYNAVDTDSDGDGLDDELERRMSDPFVEPVDTDGDGTPDFLDLDSDDDTLMDHVEGSNDSDGDGLADCIDVDSDGDALLDLEEATDLDPHTAPVDTDLDGTPDYLDSDSDNDTILDLDEGRADSDDDGVPDRLVQDADGDGILDRVEAGDLVSATPPVDTDLDGVPDYRDLDSDADGLPDAIESGCPGSTDRLLLDSDSDSYQDTAEVAVGSDPCSAASGIDAFYFVLPDTGASDRDNLIFDDTEVDQADVLLNVDTTGSMGGEITNLRNSLSTFIVPSVQAVIPDPAFAVTTFQDFPVSPFGSSASGDVPFSLEQRVTTDTQAIQTVLNGLQIRNGQDTRESGAEALRQIVEGVGVQWGPGASERVPAFDPSAGRIVGVADGTIGGAGIREDSLRIVVHVTDAPSHLSGDYPVSITAAAPDQIRSSLQAAGARVLTITQTDSPRPWTRDALESRFDGFCRSGSEPMLGVLADPQGSDSDWYELDGAAAGDQVQVSVEAFRVGSALDAMVAVYDATGSQLAFSNDRAQDLDPELTVTLAGTAPFHVAVSAFNDVDFNGSGAVTAGHFFLDVRVDGQRFGPSTLTCPLADVGDTAGTAQRLVALSQATTAGSQCKTDCMALVEHEDLRVSYGLSRATGAQVPACAWDLFGAGRPAGCGTNLCCTGAGGAGTAPDASGQCPLSFEIASDGSGIDQALVDGIEALVQFSEFEITTRVRPDPAVVSTVDTRCFIQRVTPARATAPNACAPTPRTTDTSTVVPGLDTFEDVVPGATLDFEVVAANLDSAGAPCVQATGSPQTFRAFIDVIADDVAQLATRDVIIVVPPAQRPSGQ